MADRPNLLFIFTDEQRADTMSCYGNDFVQAPSLNALSEQSFVFDNAYVTQPVCTPSRATIMTGQWPHTCGCISNNVPLKPETPTLAEMLPDDYACGYYGKWHLGDEINAQHGFDEWVSIEDNYRPYYSDPEDLKRHSDYHHYLVGRGFEPDGESLGAAVFGRTMAADLEVQHTKSAFLGREAADFIKRHREQPFCLHVNFLEPHMPFTGPLNGLYPHDQVPVGPCFRIPPAKNASLLHRTMADHYMSRIATDDEMRKVRAQYLGLVTLLDRAVGNILRALEESGQADNTIVVFTSDHGDMMGEHGIVAKCVMYEEAVRVPWLMRVPWLSRRQTHVPGRASQIDLVPTLLDLMGQPLPDHLQGVSRKDVLCGEATLADNDVFIEWNGVDGFVAAPAKPDSDGNRVKGAPWRNIVSADGWKLNLSPSDRCELYDLNTDPCEATNRFDEPSQKARIGALTDRIRAWQVASGDTAPLPEV